MLHVLKIINDKRTKRQKDKRTKVKGQKVEMLFAIGSWLLAFGFLINSQ